MKPRAQDGEPVDQTTCEEPNVGRCPGVTGIHKGWYTRGRKPKPPDKNGAAVVVQSNENVALIGLPVADRNFFKPADGKSLFGSKLFLLQDRRASRLDFPLALPLVTISSYDSFSSDLEALGNSLYSNLTQAF